MADGPKRLYLSQTDKKLAGVCGGLAAYLGVDATLVRVGWIVLTVASLGVGVIAYLAVWLLAPQAPPAATVTSGPGTN